jgi:uncharacterized membrane protein
METDRLQRRARRFLFINALSVLLWQPAMSIQDHFALSGALYHGVTLAMLAGGLVWIVSLAAILVVIMRARRTGCFQRMSDEWADHVRAKAAETTLVFTGICIVLFGVVKEVGVPGGFLLDLLVGIAVVIYLLSNVYYDSAHDPQEADE